jgi:hypothetical protein
MGRIYTIEFSGVAVTAAQDFFEILPATQKPCLVHAIFLSQSSDVGDAEEELLRVRIIRGHTTSGSGGSTPTPVPMDVNDVAAGFVGEANNTTIASAGTGVNLHSESFNIRSGFALIFTPEMRPRVQNPSLLVVRLLANPADELTMAGTMYVEEL